jgi:uncharacterized protein (TIGR02996 family)
VSDCSAEQAFLQEIASAPDDLSVRLIYADWLTDRGDPLGDFVRAQCQASIHTNGDRLKKAQSLFANNRSLEERILFRKLRIGLTHDKFHDLYFDLSFCAPRANSIEEARPQLLTRLQEYIHYLTLDPPGTSSYQRAHDVFNRITNEVKLLNTIRHPWEKRMIGELPVLDARFVRGAIERVTLSADDFLAVGDRIFAELPVLHLRLIGLSPENVRQVASSPLLGRLDELDVRDNCLGNSSTAALLSSPFLGHLRGLNLTANRLGGEEETADLLTSSNLGHLESLILKGNDLSFQDTRAILQHANLPSLKHLDLSNWEGFTPFLYTEAEDLVAYPLVTRLESLSLNGTGLSNPVELVRSPALANLRKLELGDHQDDDRCIEALAASPHLGNLRSLGLRSRSIYQPGARALACAASLGNLEELDLSGSPLGLLNGRAMALELARSSSLPNLMHLHLSHPNFDEAFLRRVAKIVRSSRPHLPTRNRDSEDRGAGPLR